MGKRGELELYCLDGVFVVFGDRLILFPLEAKNRRWIQIFQYGCNILPNILQHHCNVLEFLGIFKFLETAHHEGITSSQKGIKQPFVNLLGGGNQVYIPRVNPNWIIQ
jgi:hypothetical protein